MERNTYHPEILELALNVVNEWDSVYLLGMRCVLYGKEGHQQGNLVTRTADYGIRGELLTKWHVFPFFLGIHVI